MGAGGNRVGLGIGKGLEFRSPWGEKVYGREESRLEMRKSTIAVHEGER